VGEVQGRSVGRCRVGGLGCKRGELFTLGAAGPWDVLSIARGSVEGSRTGLGGAHRPV